MSDRPLSERVRAAFCGHSGIVPVPKVTYFKWLDEIAALEAERNAWKAVAEECKAYIVFSAIWDSILDDYGLLEGGDDE